jgi:hypothetical protein
MWTLRAWSNANSEAIGVSKRLGLRHDGGIVVKSIVSYQSSEFRRRFEVFGKVSYRSLYAVDASPKLKVGSCILQW